MQTVAHALAVNAKSLLDVIDEVRLENGLAAVVHNR